MIITDGEDTHRNPSGPIGQKQMCFLMLKGMVFDESLGIGGKEKIVTSDPTVLLVPRRHGKRRYWVRLLVEYILVYYISLTFVYTAHSDHITCEYKSCT